MIINSMRHPITAKSLFHQHGLKVTLARRKILLLVNSLNQDFFSVDDVIEYLEKKNNRASRTCITDTLNFLTNIGFLRKQLANVYGYNYNREKTLDNFQHIKEQLGV